MKATEIAAAVLKASGVEDATKDDAQTVARGILRSLQNRAGKGVGQVGEGKLAKWTLAKME
jgi:hypothetical protein